MDLIERGARKRQQALVRMRAQCTQWVLFVG